MKIELTNMVMIQDPDTGRVILQERIKSWPGLTFPGGHVEAGESLVTAAIREVREETGLEVHNLQSCGVVHWANNHTFDRYIVFLYRTSDFSGEMVEATEEGRVFWSRLEDVEPALFSSNFDRYLPMFLEGSHNEVFGSWNAEEPYEIVYY